MKIRVLKKGLKNKAHLWCKYKNIKVNKRNVICKYTLGLNNLGDKHLLVAYCLIKTLNKITYCSYYYRKFK